MADETADRHFRIRVEDDVVIAPLIVGAGVGRLEGAAVHGLQTTGIINRGTNTCVTATSRVAVAEDTTGDVIVAVVGDADAAPRCLNRPHLAHPLVDAAIRVAAIALAATPVKDQGRRVAIGLLGMGGIDTAGRDGHVLNLRTDAPLRPSGEDTPHPGAGLESGAGAIRASHRTRRGDAQGLEATAVTMTRHLIESLGLHRQTDVRDDVAALRPMVLKTSARDIALGASVQTKAVGGGTALLPREHHLHALVASLLISRKMNVTLLAAQRSRNRRKTTERRVLCCWGSASQWPG